MFTIVRREELVPSSVILHEIEAPRIARKAKPGQFVILKATETGERIPLTMADTDADAGTVTVIFMVVGKSTSLFATLYEGDAYSDLIGPLGRPTDIEKVGHVVCVGGGTGIAVLHPIARAMKKAGNRVTTILGARNVDFMILKEKMNALSDTFIPMSDDGSTGRQGFVTDALKEILITDKPDLVVAIGPVPMMKAVSELTRTDGIHTLVSLNPVMVDGTGMCGGCRVTVGDQTKFACVDGPEFDGHKVDFDGLSQRLQAYRKVETEAMEDHRCRMEAQARKIEQA
ncbi:sulfide/dihydroorotate dehydrogenase-like FAD/NAD-binding protein [Desulfobulbus alkaliphilus]|uniref:sulfide/dihydroorotate dehydrogenase-like FAD/NAD-binding protein n=1 Tax=Desulfobulbus alkaliphilus TaxID=869814 RepID=UPI001962779E|nr:sulfide/dihydroorotate dehydrogenase-like FAD/NAD-binding protein [Desulfobulbus alkaliphilus]MBM9536248.1 sulfide/dihydroorotate dehydrogenase-like FAD/NAD-binding protein [Desulfobulbus alkaliphilus]